MTVLALSVRYFLTLNSCFFDDALNFCALAMQCVCFRRIFDRVITIYSLTHAFLIFFS